MPSAFDPSVSDNFSVFSTLIVGGSDVWLPEAAAKMITLKNFKMVLQKQFLSDQ